MQVFTRPVPLFSTSTLNTFDLALSYAESKDFSGSSDLWVIRLNYDQRAAPFIYVPLPSYMSQGRQPCPDANVCLINTERRSLELAPNPRLKGANRMPGVETENFGQSQKFDEVDPPLPHLVL